jgi:hypothetical protein
MCADGCSPEPWSDVLYCCVQAAGHAYGAESVAVMADAKCAAATCMCKPLLCWPHAPPTPAVCVNGARLGKA